MFECGSGLLGGIVGDCCPVPLMKNLLAVSPGVLRKAGQVKHFRGKAHGHIIFPDGRVKALCYILVPGVLLLNASEGWKAFLNRDH